MAKNEVTVVGKETALDVTNYQNMEGFATNACFQLSNTMDRLLETEAEISSENIDKAIDCADAMVKMLAMFHKGREIQAKIETVEKYEHN